MFGSQDRKENEREKKKRKMGTSCCGGWRGTETGESEASQLWLPKQPHPLALGPCEADRAFSGERSFRELKDPLR